MDVFGGSSGSQGLGPLYPSAPLVSCEDCGKPVLATALHEHASAYNTSWLNELIPRPLIHSVWSHDPPTVNCQKIRGGGSKVKTEEGAKSLNSQRITLSFVWTSLIVLDFVMISLSLGSGSPSGSDTSSKKRKVAEALGNDIADPPKKKEVS